jgi:hypothetical protein
MAGSAEKQAVTLQHAPAAKLGGWGAAVVCGPRGRWIGRCLGEVRDAGQMK